MQRYANMSSIASWSLWPLWPLPSTFRMTNQTHWSMKYFLSNIISTITTWPKTSSTASSNSHNQWFVPSISTQTYILLMIVLHHCQFFAAHSVFPTKFNLHLYYVAQLYKKNHFFRFVIASSFFCFFSFFLSIIIDAYTVVQSLIVSNRWLGIHHLPLGVCMHQLGGVTSI